MQERMLSMFRGLLARWNALERRQKFSIAGAAAAVLLALAVSLIFAFRPNLVTIFHGVDYAFATDAQMLLDAQGINSTFESGDLKVDKANRDKAVAIIASKQPAGLERVTWADALASTGMGTTQATQRENNKQVLQSRLEAVLEQWNGVKAARVTLVLVDDTDFFLKPDENATAAVSLETARTLTQSEGLAMAQFIRTAVPKLELPNITITDQDFNLVYNGAAASQGMGLAAQSDFELQYQTIKESKVRYILAPIYDDVRVMSNFTFNWDQIITRATEYTNPMGEDTNQGLIQHETRENQAGTNQGTAAAPGTDTNNNTTPGYPTEAGEQSSVSIKNSDTTYLQNILETEKRSGDTGSVLADRSSMGVVVNNVKHYYEDKMTAAQLDGRTWNEFKSETVQTDLEIDPNVVEMLRAGTGIQNITVTGRVTPMFHDADVKPLDLRLIVLMALTFIFILLLAYGLIRRQKKEEEVVEIEPELSVEDLLATTQMEEIKEAEIKRLQEIELGEDSEVKKQIQKFMDEKPEAVAGLLRNWLNEDWE